MLASYGGGRGEVLVIFNKSLQDVIIGQHAREDSTLRKSKKVKVPIDAISAMHWVCSTQDH